MTVLKVSRTFRGDRWQVTLGEFVDYFKASPFTTKRQAQAFADLLNERPDLWQKPKRRGKA
jgi:formylglycine-generating enzyme required for sulfatase activity